MKDNKSAFNANIYDENIVCTLPYYKEFGAQIIDLVRTIGKKDIDWLDTGCGTGTLALCALQNRSDIRFTLCDPSEGMLEEAKKKLEGKDVTFVTAGSQDLKFESEFDVVTAVQSHHYFMPDERRTAVENCYKALREGGVFVTFENIRMTTEESDLIAMKRWLQFQAEHGISPEKVQFQIERRDVETHPITVEEHIKLLRECGFKAVDILWTSYLQAGIWAIK